MNILLIGDVHGKIKEYQNILDTTKSYDYSIQIGDFGFKKEHATADSSFKDKNYVLFGNHDYYPDLNKPHSLGDFGVFKESKLFYVRGAWSIDKAHRTGGLDWFKEEELDMATCERVIDAYKEALPDIMVTHDCPEEVFSHLHGSGTHQFKTRTGQLLQALWEIHQPLVWYFGHHHMSKTIELDKNHNTTIFKCLNELETTVVTI